MDLLSRFHEGHERVKHAVHSYWRQNTILSPKGRFGKAVMSCFYFSIPVVAAYFGVIKIADASESAAQERFGDQAMADAAKDKHNTTEATATSVQKIGAGGWGGGVNLATSDRDTQDVNRINLERFLKKQRKLKEKREREAAANAAARD